MTTMLCPTCFGYGHCFQVVNSWTDPQTGLLTCTYKPCPNCHGDKSIVTEEPVMSSEHNAKHFMESDYWPDACTECGREITRYPGSDPICIECAWPMGNR